MSKPGLMLIKRSSGSPNPERKNWSKSVRRRVLGLKAKKTFVSFRPHKKKICQRKRIRKRF